MIEDFILLEYCLPVSQYIIQISYTFCYYKSIKYQRAVNLGPVWSYLET